MYIQGILAVSDDFNRIRLLIDDEKTHFFLTNLTNSTNLKIPYTKSTIPDDIYGKCIFVLPTKHYKYWLEKVKEWRSKKVKIEYKQRKWNINSKKGISFDIVDIILII